mmetsp:Transcript_34325/g.49891  ORF Transcript_34325/g.49891 Transcript_34325/m.49891 type:complete len:324 (+) Transcript_34325:50-1021(+)
MCGRARVTRPTVATLRRICNKSNEKYVHENASTKVGAGDTADNVTSESCSDFNVENLSPGMDCPVIMYDHISHQFIISPMVWGLVPSYERLGSNDRPDHYKLFNKRIEKLESPYFSNLVKGDAASKSSHRNRRCLVVVDGFYEWKPSLGKKQPYYISANEPLIFSAIWDSIKIHGPNGPEELRSFAILTCNSSEFLASEIHNRQPVMLNESQMVAWIDPNSTPSDINNLLKEIEGNAANPNFIVIQLHPVTKDMTNPKYQHEDCSKPIKLETTIDSMFKKGTSYHEKSSQKRYSKEDETHPEETSQIALKKKKKATMVDYFKK